jgi:hypothetical protein
VSSKSELGFSCALDFAVHQELWILLFPQEYLQMLKDAGIIVFQPSNWADTVDEVVDLVECQIWSGEQRQAMEDKQRKK